MVLDKRRRLDLSYILQMKPIKLPNGLATGSEERGESGVTLHFQAWAAGWTDRQVKKGGGTSEVFHFGKVRSDTSEKDSTGDVRWAVGGVNLEHREKAGLEI